MVAIRHRLLQLERNVRVMRKGGTADKQDMADDAYLESSEPQSLDSAISEAAAHLLAVEGGVSTQPGLKAAIRVLEMGEEAADPALYMDALRLAAGFGSGADRADDDNAQLRFKELLERHPTSEAIPRSGSSDIDHLESHHEAAEISRCEEQAQDPEDLLHRIRGALTRRPPVERPALFNPDSRRT